MKTDDIKKLSQKKYRQEFGCFVVEGEHLVQELQKAAQHNPVLLQSTLYVTPAYQHWVSPFTTEIISERKFAAIADTENPQGILAVVPFFDVPVPVAAPGRPERAIYLHEIQDPGNLGTILRSLAWFGGFRCLLGPGSVDPWNPKAVRASMGAIFHVPMECDVAADTLKARFRRVACLDMVGEDISSPGFAACDCYLFGNEARGLPDALQQAANARAFSIGGTRAIDSLNLASAVTVCAYALTRD
jgi:RNA methyltransferase, TrmH family